MRLLVITALRDFESTEWWPIILRTPGLTGVLVLTESKPRSAWRSLRRNLRRHGPLWIPFRLAYLYREIFPGTRHPRIDDTPDVTLPVERVGVRALRDEESLATVRSWNPDLGLSVGAPILRPELFGLPKHGTINLHLGKVPDYRGAPPGFWELWTGAEEIGATVHRMDEGLDTGPILEQAVAPIYPDDDWDTVEARAHELGKIVLMRALSRAASGDFQSVSQSGSAGAYRLPTVSQRLQLTSSIALRRLRRRLRLRTVLKSTVASILLTVARPTRDFVRTLRGSHPVRVFTFHRITTLCRDGMTVTPEAFAEQLSYIDRTHRIVTLEEALEAIARRTRLRRPLAAITFDDAYMSVFSHARPFLRADSTPATVFVSTAVVGADSRFPHDADNPVRAHLPIMDWGQLATLVADGWSLGGHTVHHVRMAECSPELTRVELADSFAVLREHIGSRVVAFAYPFGGRTDIRPEQSALALELGYRAILSNFGGENTTNGNSAFVRRFDIGGQHPRLAWKSSVRGFDLAALELRFSPFHPPATP